MIKMDNEDFEKISESLKCIGLDINKLASNFNAISNINISSSDELMTLLSFESHDNFKHLSILIGLNLIELINENALFLEDHYITVGLTRILGMFESKFNIMLRESDDSLMKYVIESYIDSKLTHLSSNDIEANKDLIDNYRANYCLMWYHYQDFISKIVKQVVNGYVTYLCTTKLDKSKFLYVIICGVFEFLWKNADSSETYGPIKENILSEFKKIHDDVSFLIDLKGEEYLDSIIDIIKGIAGVPSHNKIISVLDDNSSNKIIVEGSMIFDKGSKMIKDATDGKFSSFIFYFVRSLGYDFLIKCSVIKQYLLIKRIIESFSITEDFMESIIRLNNNMVENKRYMSILSGKCEGLMYKQFELTSDEKYLFKSEDGNVEVFINKPTLISDRAFIDELFNGLNENIKLFGRYSDYDIKNLRKIVSLIRAGEPMSDVTINNYLTSGLLMTTEKLTEMNSYLETFKIKRISDKNDMLQLTEGEKQRLKIIKMLLDDKPIWVIDDCLFNINDNTKKVIIDIIMAKFNKGGKTLLVVDTSNSANYWKK